MARSKVLQSWLWAIALDTQVACENSKRNKVEGVGVGKFISNTAAPIQQRLARAFAWGPEQVYNVLSER